MEETWTEIDFDSVPLAEMAELAKLTTIRVPEAGLWEVGPGRCWRISD